MLLATTAFFGLNNYQASAETLADSDGDGIPDVVEGRCEPTNAYLNAGTSVVTGSSYAGSNTTNYVATQDLPGDPSPLAPNEFINGIDTAGGASSWKYTYNDPVHLYVDDNGTLTYKFYFYNNVATTSGSYYAPGTAIAVNFTDTDDNTVSGSYSFTEAEITQLDAGHWVYKEIAIGGFSPNQVLVLKTLATTLETNTTGYYAIFNPQLSEVFAMAPLEIKTCAEHRDTDSDGTPDYLDLDSDDDGIADELEAGQTPATPVDTDGDGVEDYLDLDADNDGIPDSVESRLSEGYQPGNLIDLSSNLVDTDSDGTPDYLDLDSDNDGKTDQTESGLTLSGTDADNDGIDDAVGASYADPDGIVNNPGTDLANEAGDTSETGYREIGSPAITLTKDSVYEDTDQDGGASVGDTIKYTFVVTNTGDVTLYNITIDDPLVSVSGSLDMLAMGASNDSAFTATYTITQTDIDYGRVDNTAVAKATDPDGVEVTATSTDPTPVDSDWPNVTTEMLVLAVATTEDEDEEPETGLANTGDQHTIFYTIAGLSIVVAAGALLKTRTAKNSKAYTTHR